METIQLPLSDQFYLSYLFSWVSFISVVLFCLNKIRHTPLQLLLYFNTQSLTNLVLKLYYISFSCCHKFISLFSFIFHVKVQSCVVWGMASKLVGAFDTNRWMFGGGDFTVQVANGWIALGPLNFKCIKSFENCSSKKIRDIIT